MEQNVWREGLQKCFLNRDKVTLTFEMGRHNRMIISKAAVQALGNPRYASLLVNPHDRSLLLMGTTYPSPDCIHLGRNGPPMNKCRQELITRLISLTGWKNGYRYTLSAIVLDIAGNPALSFHLRNVVSAVPMKTHPTVSSARRKFSTSSLLHGKGFYETIGP